MANPTPSIVLTYKSTLTLQNILDKILPLGDINPVLANVGGYQLEPFVTICTDVMTDIIGQPFPYKWNEVQLPPFYTNSYQQDYALVNSNGTSVLNVEWLERGIAIIQTSNSMPRAYGIVECGRQLPQATGSVFQAGTGGGSPTFVVNLFPNKMLYYGVWGASNSGGNSTFGNNPGPGSIYTNPLQSLGNSQPNNPINQVQDPNGNFQVVTTYGTCGQSQPNWPNANAAPGTTTQDGTTIWTVVDPYGAGVRILPVPSQTGAVFQFSLVGQMPPTRFTALNQTLYPMPDKFEPYFRQGVIAQCYRYSSVASVQAKFEKNYQIWLKSLIDLRENQDRELEENVFTPERGIMGDAGDGARGRGRWIGGAWPFNYPY